MALQPTQKVTRAGVALPAAMAACAAGDTFLAGSGVFLRVRNASGGDQTVTVTPPAAGGALSLTLGAPAAVNVVATTGDVILGPFPIYPFAGPDGTAKLTYSGTTSLTIAVLDCSG